MKNTTLHSLCPFYQTFFSLTHTDLRPALWRRRVSQPPVNHCDKCVCADRSDAPRPGDPAWGAECCTWHWSCLRGWASILKLESDLSQSYIYFSVHFRVTVAQLCGTTTANLSVLINPNNLMHFQSISPSCALMCKLYTCVCVKEGSHLIVTFN